MSQFEKVAAGIRREIEQGTWRVGDTLPSERKTAERYDVSRSTVRRAWQELQSLGYVEWGAMAAPLVVNIPLRPEQISRGAFSLELPPQSSPTFLSDLMSAAGSTARYNFEIGMPDPELLPLKELQAVMSDLLSRHAGDVFAYSPTQGIPRVRQAVSEEYLMRRGIEVDASEVLMTSGSLQGLDYLTELLVAPGDVVVTESPTFAGALQVFAAHGATIMALPIDGEGLMPDSLESALMHHNVRLIYVQSAYQNPTSTVMSMARRWAVLDIASRFGVPIVEDDAYGFLSEAGQWPLRSLDRGGAHVIYLNTLSKILAPGLRVGFVVAPADIIHRLSQRKQRSDLHTGTVTQLLVEGWLRSGNVSEHITRVQAVYAARLHAAYNIIARRGLQIFGHPSSGFYLFVKLPPTLNVYALHQHAAVREVLFSPGAAFGPPGVYDHWIRLCVSAQSPTALHGGLSRLFRMMDMAAQGRPLP